MSTRRPSGLNTMLLTGPECPLKDNFSCTLGSDSRTGNATSAGSDELGVYRIAGQQCQCFGGLSRGLSPPQLFLSCQAIRSGGLFQKRCEFVIFECAIDNSRSAHSRQEEHDESGAYARLADHPFRLVLLLGPEVGARLRSGQNQIVAFRVAHDHSPRIQAL